jgi:hypothetical protein
MKKIEEKIKSHSLFRLEPIKKNPQRQKRLMSSLISKNS